MSGVVITGAASGIGRATAVRLAARGVPLLLVDLDVQGLNEMNAELGDASRTVHADVANEEDVRRYCDEAAGAFGRLDGILINAGIAGARRSIVETTAGEWRRTIDIDLDSAFLGLKYLIPLLARPGGSVVCISSVTASRAESGRSDYVAAKAGLIGLTRTAVAEHAAEGLRFNCVCPGPIDTAMMDEIEEWSAPTPEAARVEMTGKNPSGRYGKPEEVAALIEFLLLGESAYVNGAAIPIDGGYLAIG